MDQTIAKDILSSFKADADKALEHLKNEYLLIRAGRANVHILDKVFVDYYGSPTPISQMANLSVPEARMLAISVWDLSQLQNVSKAIQAADLGVSPMDDGRVIRLIFPTLTEERRKELAKQIRTLCENCKISIRNARRDAMDMVKELKKEISEDDAKSMEGDIQKQVDIYNANADEQCVKKEKEVMEI